MEEGLNLGLIILGKEDWVSLLEEGRREWVGIKDLLGRRELVVEIAIMGVRVVLDEAETDRIYKRKERDLKVGRYLKRKEREMWRVL